MADAFQTFVAQPRHLIRIMLEPHGIISFHYINLYLYLYITYNLIQMFFILQKLRRKPSLEKKHEVPVDDHIAFLALAARQIGQDPFEVPWDDTFFQINTKLPLYMYMIDLLEFVAGDQELNINIIQFFMM